MRRSMEQERRHRRRNKDKNNNKHKTKNKHTHTHTNKLHHMPLSSAAGPGPLVPKGFASAQGVTVMYRPPTPSALQEAAVRVEKRRRRRRHAEGVSCAARVAAGSFWSR